MTTPHICGLTGFAGAGKDTAARYIAEALSARGHSAVTMRFDELIHQMIRGLGVHPCYEGHAERYQWIPGLSGATYTHLFDTLRDEWCGQCMGSNFLLHYLESRLKNPNLTARFVILFDLELPSQLNWLRTRGGHVIHVVRPGFDQLRSRSLNGIKLPYDSVLENDADLINLRARCGSVSNILLAESALEA